MKIAINAGHYPGLDSGAVGMAGLEEAVVNQDIMVKVAAYLRVVAYEVLEIQENVLSKITGASNNFGAELFISIHCNGAIDPSARGTETFSYLGSKSNVVIFNNANKLVEYYILKLIS